MKRHSVLLTAALVIPNAVFAQSAPPPTKAIASAAEIQALIAKAKTMPPQPSIVQPLVSGGTSQTSLDYRAIPGAPPSQHDAQDELIYVLDGAGTFTLGGSLENAKHTDAANQTGSAITGGVASHVTKGAFILVPAGQAHAIVPDAGGAIVLVGIHVPNTAK